MALTQIFHFHSGFLFMWETLGKTVDCVYAPFKEANKWKNQ